MLYKLYNTCIDVISSYVRALLCLHKWLSCNRMKEFFVFHMISAEASSLFSLLFNFII